MLAEATVITVALGIVLGAILLPLAIWLLPRVLWYGFLLVLCTPLLLLAWWLFVLFGRWYIECPWTWAKP